MKTAIYLVASPILAACSRGVVVITCASHAQGPRFDPGREQFWPEGFSHITRVSSKTYLDILLMDSQLPRGLVVRIRRSHRRGRGSIPRTGTTFFKEPLGFSLSSMSCSSLSAILGSIVVSISACHAEDRGSIPRRGVTFFFRPTSSLGCGGP